MTRSANEDGAGEDGAAAVAPEEQPPALAATVVLVRDGVTRDVDGGLEVLLLERPRDHGSFAGAWVFPGGRVDPEDRLDGGGELAPAGELAAEERAARRAAVREVHEETGLIVPPETLVPIACWVPPQNVPRRFRTWFYVAPVPTGDIVPSAQEVMDVAWLRPARALALHASGALSLVPPTWVTLHGLTADLSVADALDRMRDGAVQHFVSRLRAGSNGPVLLWDGDVAYADDALFDTDGPRHRLEIGALPWVYRNSAAEQW
jgi:8-oxo-dGTP pyrophosphatase MutT (NUDIX family)